MTSDERHQRMDAARVQVELSVQTLWLHYVALGGTGDAFDLDGFLQGLVPLEDFQQDILAQSLNEALEDDYRSYRIPLSTLPPGDADDDQLSRLVDELLENRPPPQNGSDPPGAGPT